MSNKLSQKPESTAQPTHFIAMVGGVLKRLTWAGFVALLDLIWARIASPEFTGNPTAPTQTAGDNSTRIATTAYADNAAAVAAAAIVDSSPVLLNTLNELAAALGDDPDFAATTAAAIGAKADSIALTTHTSNTSNPHSVTKAQVGLGNVTNDAQLKAADLDVDSAMAANSDAKIASQKAVKTALAGKASSSDLTTHTSNTSNPHSVTKSQVGLGNVTNDAQLKAADLDTDSTMTANSDAKIASQKAVKTALAGKAASSHTHAIGDLPVATQAEAEAGTNTTKVMTPERTAQAIAALAGGGGGVSLARGSGVLQGHTAPGSDPTPAVGSFDFATWEYGEGRPLDVQLVVVMNGTSFTANISNGDFEDGSTFIDIATIGGLGDPENDIGRMLTAVAGWLSVVVGATYITNPTSTSIQFSSSTSGAGASLNVSSTTEGEPTVYAVTGATNGVDGSAPTGGVLEVQVLGAVSIETTTIPVRIGWSSDAGFGGDVYLMMYLVAGGVYYPLFQNPVLASVASSELAVPLLYVGTCWEEYITGRVDAPVVARLVDSGGSPMATESLAVGGTATVWVIAEQF